MQSGFEEDKNFFRSDVERPVLVAPVPVPLGMNKVNQSNTSQ